MDFCTVFGRAHPPRLDPEAPLLTEGKRIQIVCFPFLRIRFFTGFLGRTLSAFQEHANGGRRRRRTIPRALLVSWLLSAAEIAVNRCPPRTILSRPPPLVTGEHPHS